jgi:hypothetical protein
MIFVARLLSLVVLFFLFQVGLQLWRSAQAASSAAISARIAEGHFFSQVADRLAAPATCTTDVKSLSSAAVQVEFHATTPGRAEVLVSTGDLHRAVPLLIAPDGHCELDRVKARADLNNGWGIGPECTAVITVGRYGRCFPGYFLARQAIPIGQVRCCPFQP